ncbi:hypothetical protein M4I21_17885 [Cellulophaga sp. 20_2_10]|uniref:hypothetical protein n=1 Tax=Cellulophaga sp. 20_2_10 TaxID=2942476 RepID=UPI00201A5C76|nr:hypothetical protein [Cellulophaga sp. 20_2_10]MCL5247688.1 hypothetical protein [Cellulophaga sp. 20_2_10]
MKKILLIFLTLHLVACTSYPEEPPYLVGKEHFTLDTVTKIAPYTYTNTVATEDSYFTHYLPQDLEYSKSSKKWDIIDEKYKALMFYGIDTKGNKVYINRNITKWHYKKVEGIMEIATFFEILKKEGVLKKECEVLINNADKKLNSRYILLRYKGVKHDITLTKKEIRIASYPEVDQPYWESQGQFMPDTPTEKVKKWLKENR